MRRFILAVWMVALVGGGAAGAADNVGWYLLRPPLVKSHERWGPDNNAPDSEWRTLAAFSTVEECKKILALCQEHVRSGKPVSSESIKPGTPEGEVLAVLELGRLGPLFEECISVLDPRLAPRPAH